jgi:serine/threonine-protein kinase
VTEKIHLVRPAGIPLGRYTLGERLGVGGMGEVYLAIQSGIGGFEKPLALKLLLPHLAQRRGVVDRFLEEAHLAAKMNHINVAQIFDVGSENGRYFIAMELVRGVALSVLISALREAGQQLPVELVSYIGRAVCDGLHHAHCLADGTGRPLNVVHRDVTPHNILVSVDGAVKLTDFGIARASSAREQRHVMGKLGYVAPEQMKGETFDCRADLFSLGVTLFQLATLRTPFTRDSDEETSGAVLTEPLPRPGALRPDLPEGLVLALEKSTAKLPADRFADARAMRDALPAPHTDAADHLSALVKAVCASDIDQLDARTQRIATLQAAARASTGSVSADPPPPSRPRANPWLIGVGVGLGVFAIALVVVQRVGAVPAPAVPPPLAASLPAPDPVEPPPAPVEPEAPRPAPPPVEVERRAPAREARPKAQHTGYISIDARPWAEVRVDGRKAGETPIASFPVDADGKAHEIELRNPDTHRVIRKWVKVTEGQRTFVKVDLK